jgi:hypothetical protein
MKNTRVKILKIALDFSEFMPKMMTEYALKIMQDLVLKDFDLYFDSMNVQQTGTSFLRVV